jgi:predicted transposase/invertase (TIGR01784 family)
MYDTSLKRKWDNQNALNYARNEGKREGEHRKAVEKAIAMKKDGLSIEAIRKYTGLSKEEIEKL